MTIAWTLSNDDCVAGTLEIKQWNVERIHEGKQLYYLSRVLAASLSENVNPWLRWVWSNERIRSTDRFISRIANNSPQEIIIVQRRSITRWIYVLRFYESLDNKNFETCRDAFLSLNSPYLDCNKKKGGRIVGRIVSTPMQHYDSLSFSFDAYVKSQWLSNAMISRFVRSDRFHGKTRI